MSVQNSKPPISIGSIPEAALEVGKGGGRANDAPPAEQREIHAGHALSEGPKVGDLGEYKPASYRVKGKQVRTDR